MKIFKKSNSENKVIILKNGKRGAYMIGASGSLGNQQITKDVGLIPYLLHKNHGFDSCLVSYKISEEVFEYAEKYTPGMRLESLPDDSLETRLNYISEHAAEIDLLILYGAYPQYIPIVDFYKKVRPDGKIYLSTDMNIAWADRTQHDAPDYKNFLKSCDVVAASCRATQKYLCAKWSVPVDLIRNPFYNFTEISFDNLFEQKENIILTVGRIGSEQKRTDILLNAFANCAEELPDWKIRLVGSVEKSFDSYIEDFFEKHPDLKTRVDLVGLIENRTQLLEEYKRAKIFCLPSNFEGGTPNVTGEALYCGCYMISSAIDAKDCMTNDEKCGKIFPVGDVDALTKIFLEVCRDEDLLLKGGKNAAYYAREQFDANHVVARLYYLLYGGK